MNGPAHWWLHDDLRERFVRDLLAAEMAALRPGGWSLPPAPWPCGLHWRDDLGADSLELMALSAALSEAVQLNDPDAARSLYERPTLENWQAVAQTALTQASATQAFRSSGSTGAPGRNTHPLNRLLQEIEALSTVVDARVPPIGRIVSTVRGHHIYGFLLTVLLPHRWRQWGRSVEVLDMVAMPPPAVMARLQPGDLLVSFPMLWQAMARTGLPWPDGVVGVTSTAPCPPELCGQLRHSGLSRLVHLYGSSETAGIGWREGGQEAFELLPFWQRLAGDDTRLMRQDPDGSTSTLPLPDHLQWSGPRRFLPAGRVDGEVQVGGVNVRPAEVARQLCRHPGVKEAMVRLHGPDGQQRLKAFVVAAAGHEETVAEALLAWSRRHLAPAARPVHVQVGQALPVNAQGKACDWAIEGT